MNKALHFFFSCPTCGAYRVTRERFEQYAGHGNQLALRREIAAGAQKVEIKFDGPCPACMRPGDKIHGELASYAASRRH